MPFQAYGKMRRDTAGQIDFGVYDSSGGLNIKSAPQELADNELTQALNGYLRIDGGFESRRGMNLYNTLPTSQPVTGMFRFGQFVKGGNEVTVRQTLAQANNELWNADTRVIIGTLGQAKDNPMPWQVCMGSDPQAMPQPNAISGLTDVAVICVGGDAGPYIYDGTSVYHPTGWKQAKGASWCVNVNGVVWFGGIKGFPNQIMSTGTGIAPDVSFETIAGYSVFVLPLPVTGLSFVGAGAQAMVCAGLPNGLALLYGTGPGNYTLQMVPMDNDGVVSGYSMVANNGGVYFLGNYNVYTFNPLTSLTPTPISQKVQPWLTPDPFTTGYAMNGDRTRFFAWMYFDRYQLAYASDTAGVYDTILCYDTIVQGWTVLSLGVPITSACLLNAPGDVAPFVSLVGAPNGRILQWDPYVGYTDTVWDESVWNAAFWDDSTTNLDMGASIQVWWATKYFKVGEPGTVKTLHRVYPEIIYPGVFGGTLTIQTDYGQETVFTADVFVASQQGGVWDASLWDNAFWASFPPARASWNAPASRIDITSQIPGYPGQFMVWNINDWNQAPWASNPLPTTNAPGIQAEAFSFGMQSGFSTGGAIWDMSKWDQSSFGQFGQLPWVISGLSGTFSQNGKR